MEHVTHTLEPVYDTDSRILILGTMPSVTSREEGFYYAHKSNRFWAVLGCVFSCDCPVTVNQKKEFLKTHHIALWDVLQSCEIHGSGDASIRNIVTNPVEQLLPHTKITGIYTTGKKAFAIYEKYLYPKTGIHAVCLPSPSAANCAVSLEMLVNAYGQLRDGE